MNKMYGVEDEGWVTRFLLPRLKAMEAGRKIIAIGGPSGVGKSTLGRGLVKHLNRQGHAARDLGMDDFFKSPAERARLGEWDPTHVRLDELRRVLGAFCEGVSHFDTVRYVRKPRAELVPWRCDWSGIELLVFEGLYALSNNPDAGNLHEFADLGIFLTASPANLKAWRFQQEREKPNGRDELAMERHWQEGIVPDTRDLVMPTAQNAQLLLYKDDAHRFSVTEQ